MKRDLTERVEVPLVESKTVQQAAAATQKVIVGALSKEPVRPMKNYLNGTWLEHPLHPVLTDVPIGAWTITMVLDLLALLFGVKRLGKASGAAAGMGILGAVGAATTGAADWVDVDPPELAVGFVHATTNIIATLFFAVSFLMRRADDWRITIRSFIPALMGYATVSAGAFLGGSLVYRRGVMINRNAWSKGPENYVTAIALQDLVDNSMKRVMVEGQPVLLYRRGDTVQAISAVCSHYGGPLDEGKVQDDIVECPWHGSRFDLSDGSVVSGPTTAPVPAYDVQVENGQVRVKSK